MLIKAAACALLAIDSRNADTQPLSGSGKKNGSTAYRGFHRESAHKHAHRDWAHIFRQARRQSVRAAAV
jgi:hypothetical protein